MTEPVSLQHLINMNRELTQLEAVEADNMRRNVPTTREHFGKVQNLRIRLLRDARAWIRAQGESHGP